LARQIGVVQGVQFAGLGEVTWGWFIIFWLG